MWGDFKDRKHTLLTPPSEINIQDSKSQPNVTWMTVRLRRWDLRGTGVLVECVRGRWSLVRLTLS